MGSDILKTLYVSDLDGTLLNKNQQISEETASILNHLTYSGLYFTIATARFIDSVRDIIKPLKLQLPYILANGVFVYDAVKNDYIKCSVLDKLLGQEIIYHYQQNGLNPLVYTVDDDFQSRVYYQGIYNQSEHNYISNRIHMGDKRFRLVSNYNECLSEKIITLIAIDLPERLEPIYEIFNKNKLCQCHYGPDIYTAGYYWLEITHHDANKGNALLFLKEYLNADKLVCFGDNLNDLSMFEVADEKYTVSNGHGAMIKAANQVIASNEENGVAHYLKSLHTFKSECCRSDLST